MEGLNPAELPATLSMLPGYPNILINRRLWTIVLCQLLVCLTSSAWISYYLSKKLYRFGNMSWKKAIEIMGPIGKRLQNLEKERAVWQCYLEWIEDYCSVYYGLLNYLNTAATDLDKICNDSNLKIRSESLGMLIESEVESTKGDSQNDDEMSSEADWDKMGGAIDTKMTSNFAKALSNMRLTVLENSCGAADGEIKGIESISGTSWGMNSTTEDLYSSKGTGEEAESSEVLDSDHLPEKREKVSRRSK